MVAQQTAHDIKDAAIDFLNMVVARDIREAYRKHMAPNFRHHNPYYRGDAKSLMTGMEEQHAKYPDTSLEVQRALQDGDLVAVHSRVTHRPGDRGMPVVHIFRFEGDLIAEMWDIGQELPDDSPNQYGAF